MVSDYDLPEFTLRQEELEQIENIMASELIGRGVHSAILIDMAGNIVVKIDNGQSEHDLYSMAALASANYAAVDTMAKIVGEEEFSLLFHKGESESIHFCKVMKEYLLINIFGREVPLGILRLKISETIDKIKHILS